MRTISINVIAVKYTDFDQAAVQKFISQKSGIPIELFQCDKVNLGGVVF